MDVPAFPSSGFHRRSPEYHLKSCAETTGKNYSLSTLSGFCSCATIAVALVRAFDPTHIEPMQEMFKHSRHFHRHHVCFLGWSCEFHNEVPATEAADNSA